MLQYRTVYPKTLELLNKLMSLQELKDFFLVGGTALSLQIGHRISIDLDLFCLNEFDVDSLLDTLESKFIIHNVSKDKNTLNMGIEFPANSKNLVKVDFIRHAYPIINKIIELDSIRLLSIEDIIPMKLSAVAGRGSKKDFYDIYFLLQKYTMSEMFDYFDRKFTNINKFHIIKSLTYFDDAEFEPSPQLISKIEWNEVKVLINQKTLEYLNK